MAEIVKPEQRSCNMAAIRSHDGNLIAQTDIRHIGHIDHALIHADVPRDRREYAVEPITNKSLRERFGLTNSSAASISRLIKEAVNEGLIKPLDPDTAPRYMKYIPYWA